jgi:hypothetical protein
MATTRAKRAIKLYKTEATYVIKVYVSAIWCSLAFFACQYHLNGDLDNKFATQDDEEDPQVRMVVVPQRGLELLEQIILRRGKRQKTVLHQDFVLGVTGSLPLLR